MRDIFFQNSLKFDIYTIGYKTQGECIVFLLKADSKIVYSGIVDCFKIDDINYAISILNEENIKYFNFVCWTHPHYDHTLGLDDILKNHCNDDTYFWMPFFDFKNINSFSKEAQELYKTIEKIISERKKKRLHVNAVVNSMCLEQITCRNITKYNNYSFSIKSFAPSGEIIVPKELVDSDYTVNTLSIGLLINIGEFNIMLAGDVENKTITTVPDFYINYPIDYLKIPHHASKTAIKLIDRMEDLTIPAPTIATTTVFRSYDLPDIDVINKYKRWNNELCIFSSGNLDGRLDKEAFGVVKTVFDILQNDEIVIEITLIGNAVQL